MSNICFDSLTNEGISVMVRLVPRMCEELFVHRCINYGKLAQDAGIDAKLINVLHGNKQSHLGLFFSTGEK